MGISNLFVFSVEDSKYFEKLRHMIAGIDTSFLSSKTIDQLQEVVFPNEPWLECLFKGNLAFALRAFVRDSILNSLNRQGLRNLRAHIDSSAKARAQAPPEAKAAEANAAVKRSMYFTPRLGRTFY